MTEAGGYSEGLLQQAKSCRQAMLELTHEINPYQELKDFILLQAHLELAKLAGVENDTESFQKHLKACYELPDQPDDAQFMNMKRTARELPKKFEPAPSVTKPATSRKSATTSSSNTNDGIDKNMIGVIVALAIVFLLLYACGAA